MKSTKFLLIAIAVISVVSAGLAFKAKTYGVVKYCTSGSGGSTCPNYLANSTIIPGSTPAATYYYEFTNGTDPSQGDPCSGINCRAVSTTFYRQ